MMYVSLVVSEWEPTSRRQSQPVDPMSSGRVVRDLGQVSAAKVTLVSGVYWDL
jgi:hypothetical protein